MRCWTSFWVATRSPWKYPVVFLFQKCHNNVYVTFNKYDERFSVSFESFSSFCNLLTCMQLLPIIVTICWNKFYINFFGENVHSCRKTIGAESNSNHLWVTKHKNLYSAMSFYGLSVSLLFSIIRHSWINPNCWGFISTMLKWFKCNEFLCLCSFAFNAIEKVFARRDYLFLKCLLFGWFFCSLLYFSLPSFSGAFSTRKKN